MNKKGFTLAELIAIVAILGAFALIVTISVGPTLKKSKTKLSEIQIQNIKDAAKMYYLNEGMNEVDSNSKACVDVEYLIENDYIDKSQVKNPKDDSEILGSVKITYDSKKYKYEYQDNVCIPEPKSFGEDSWETIAANVKAGNLSVYKVGDTKEIALTGFTNEETDSNGLYTIRIANTSTPEECKTTGFSQTACGFVIEFVDIITTHLMNPTGEYKGVEYIGGWNVDGYPASLMYTYIQNDIYNALPEELRNNIINTTVVSGHGATSGETNFVSEDKLYLLSTKEVWEQGTSNIIDYDTARENTRQLDYYSNMGVSTSNYSVAIKNYNGNACKWSLRSAGFDDIYFFYNVYDNGAWNNQYASDTDGVAVAFRIG